MPYSSLPGVYTVRVNPAIRKVLDTEKVPLYVLTDLSKLSEYVSTDDICSFIYFQTSSDTLNEYCAKTHIPNFLKSPDAQKWLEENKDNIRYDEYVQRMEESNTQVETPLFKIPVESTHRVLNKELNFDLSRRFIYIEPIEYSEEDFSKALNTITQEGFAVNNNAFKENMLEYMYKFYGYDVLVSHPALHCILD